MRRFARGLVAAALLSVGACAQGPGRAVPPEQRYCEALSELYQRYVGNPVTEPRNIRRNDAEADLALSQCRQRNAGPAIPVLERKLLDAGFTLPQRG